MKLWIKLVSAGFVLIILVIIGIFYVYPSYKDNNNITQAKKAYEYIQKFVNQNKRLPTEQEFNNSFPTDKYGALHYFSVSEFAQYYTLSYSTYKQRDTAIGKVCDINRLYVTSYEYCLRIQKDGSLLE